jgi:hypothetical protein
MANPPRITEAMLESAAMPRLAARHMSVCSCPSSQVDEAHFRFPPIGDAPAKDEVRGTHRPQGRCDRVLEDDAAPVVAE